MTKVWRFVAVSAVTMLGIIYRAEIKDGIVATVIWVQFNRMTKEGESYDNDACRAFYRKISNDWWYINTALRRFDMETYRTCLHYHILLSISRLPGLTERMACDFDSNLWTGSREMAGAMILFYRTGEVRYLRRMFDVVLYPDNNMRNKRARRYYLNAAVHFLNLSSVMEFLPRSSSDLPDSFWIDACNRWRISRIWDTCNTVVVIR